MSLRRWPCIVVLLAACSNNRAPELMPIEPQLAYVGSRFELRVAATDPEGDSIQYDYSCPGLDIADRARLVKVGSEGVFSWTPIAPDLGEHRFDFTASDGSGTDVESVTITVRASSQDTAPIFRKPLGEGTTLDLSANTCLNVDVLVEDPDSVDVAVRQDPAIAGSTLKMNGMSGVFNWCPTREQAEVQRFTLHLVADDHDNPPVLKDYTILIRSNLPPVCPGEAPVIQFAPPPDQTTADNISISAIVTDDQGLKGAPVVYYTTTPPPNPSKLDYGTLSQLGMTPDAPGSTTFLASLPNPTQGLAAGDSRTLYYVLVAEDDDDPTGNCDHRTQSPQGDVYELVVTRPAAVTCTGTGQCPAGQVCDGSTCIPDTCSPADSNGDGLFWEQSGCPANHFCPAKGPVPSPSHCALSCTSDADCTQAGTKCKVFDTKPGCALEGTKIVGSGCASFTDCKGKAMCLPWPGGYCTISDCNSDGSFSGACPSGSACIPMPDSRFVSGLHFLCLKTCTAALGQCRTSQNYDCKTATDDKGVPQQVCLQ